MESRTPGHAAATSRRRSAAAAALLPLGLALVACGGDADDDTGADRSTEPPSSSAPVDGGDTTSSPAPSTSEPTSEPADQGSADDVTAAGLAAIRTAEQRAGGTAYAIDDSGDDEGWEVEVAVNRRSVEVQVSGDGRQVRGTDQEDLDGDDRRALDRARTDLSRAITVTIDQHGGVLDEAGLDDDDDRYHWSVNLRSGDEYDVDLTGDTARRSDRDDD